MKFLKKISILFFYLPASVLFAEWYDSQAEYRLKVIAKEKGEVVYFDLDKNKLFPDNFEKGLSVFTTNGKKIPYAISRNNKRIFVYPEQSLNSFYVYFGYKEKCSPNSKQNIKQKLTAVENIRLTTVRAYKKCSPDKLSEYFKKPIAMRNILNKKTLHEIHLMDDNCFSPFNLVHRIEGRLIIDETGEYSFAVISNSNTNLLINDEMIIESLKIDTNSAKRKFSKKIILDKGCHKYSLFYKKNLIKTYLIAEMKRPEDNKFHILKDIDFAPAIKGEIEYCEDRNNKKIPIVSFDLHHLLFNDQKIRFISITVDEPKLFNNENFLWYIDGEKRECGKNISLKLNNNNFTLTLECENKNIKNIDYSLEFNEPLSTLIRLNSNLLLPEFIYDTSTNSAEYIISYRNNKNLNMKLEVKTFYKQNKICHSEWITLKGENYTESLKNTFTHKYKYLMDKQNKGSSFEVQFTLLIPPVKFDYKPFACKPIKECKSIIETYDGFVDKSNKRIIPVLHMPSLAERRRWQIPRLIANHFRKIKKVTVLSDDFGMEDNKFSKKIQNGYKKNGINSTFITWSKNNVMEDRFDFGKLIKKISAINSDTLLIIPSSQLRNNSIEFRKNILAAVIQLAKSNQNIKNIIVSTPLATPINNNSNKKLSKEIIKLADRYYIKHINLFNFITGIKDYKEYYKVPTSKYVYESYPIRLTDKIVYKIKENIK